MSININSAAACPSIARRPLIDVLVERLAHRLLRWSERPVLEVRYSDRTRREVLADERAVATAHPVRWY